VVDHRTSWGILPQTRSLASLGALSLVELDHCSVVDLLNARAERSEKKGIWGSRRRHVNFKSVNKHNFEYTLYISPRMVPSRLYGKNGLFWGHSGELRPNHHLVFFHNRMSSTLDLLSRKPMSDLAEPDRRRLFAMRCMSQ
jgi:hypothetical protein